ncbi:MAG: DUF2330 domain-containing protein [Deltaproteobacteria bacterium]|nr:DUF2330 domain-containing protein [Deltaproteobacteria bacterium]
MAALWLPLAIAACVGVSLVPRVGLACGGCFGAPIAPGEPVNQAVLQNAERVLFVRDVVTKQSTVWVEVRYAGLAQDFGWVLPVPKLPKVGVGVAKVFDALDVAMRARVRVTGGPPENCADPAIGCASFDDPEVGDSAGWISDAASSSDGAASAGGPGGVQVLDAGVAGPYNYVVVKGSEAATLFNWLNNNGYATPAKATAILQSHIANGDLFVAIKLQNGAGIDAIRPVTLTMDDAEPCVPLRLTAIAATANMNVVVTVAGPARAVVKNHLDVTVNPLRLTLMDGPFVACEVGKPAVGNCLVPKHYSQVAALAMDEAGGHAFVTEYAAAGAATPNMVVLGSQAMANLAGVETMAQFVGWVQGNAGNDPEYWPAYAPHLDTKAILPGQPIGKAIGYLLSCAAFVQTSMGQTVCNWPGGVTLDWPVVSKLPVDGAAMAATLDKEIVQPMAAIAAMVAKSAKVTRLSMVISPEEMDRDPVFAYNPALPDVSQIAVEVSNNKVCLSGWTTMATAQRMTLANLGSWLLSNTTIVDPMFYTLPAAAAVVLLDETGGPLPIAPDQASLVDAAIAGAKPGKPSLPSGLVLKPAPKWAVPPSDPLVTTIGGWPQPYGCVPKPGWVQGLPPPKSPPPDADAQDTNAGTSSDADIAAAPDIAADVAADVAGPVDGGPVPGVDAQGGWKETPTAPPSDGGVGPTDGSPAADGASAGPTAPAAKPKAESGCVAAGSAAGGGPWAVAGLLALAWAWLRRMRARYSAQAGERLAGSGATR